MKSPSNVLACLGITLLLINQTHGECYDPSPAFLPPPFDSSDPILRSVFTSLEQTLESLGAENAFNTTSFSVEVTSLESTLWSYHHTAKELNSSRPGANPVNDHSFYRIASVTKTFTTLALLEQAAAGNLSLDDPVTLYLADLKGSIPWKDITLRTLASQLSGITRDWSQGDILPAVDDPTAFGLPPPNNPNLPQCYGYNEAFIPCNKSHLYYALSYAQPLFAPNQQSTYSNTAFELLGLVLANVTSKPYEEVIYDLLTPLGISTSTGATFIPPPDNLSVLPSGVQYYHDVHQGVHNPTGGLFMTTSAMSIYLRHILHHFNSPSTLSLQAGNWLTPHSFTSSLNSFYGMPWEIFRSDTLLSPTRRRGRPVTFFTKGGGVPGYFTHIILVPDYNLGFCIFTAGNQDLLAKLTELVTVRVIRAADKAVAQQIHRRYTGTYTPSHSQPMHPGQSQMLNTSLTLKYTPESGLYIDTLISNGTLVFDAFEKAFPEFLSPDTRPQVLPTGLYVDEGKKRGERWRMIFVPLRGKKKTTTPAGEENKEKKKKNGEEDGVKQKDEDEETEGIWDNFCVPNIDFLMYDGRALGEIVFWSDHHRHDKQGEKEESVKELDLLAFRIRLAKVDGDVHVHVHGDVVDVDEGTSDNVDAGRIERVVVQD